MYKICFLAGFIFCMYSCNTKKSFDNGKWQTLDSTRGLSYSISEKGKGDKGDLALKYVGWIKDDKLIQDTAAKSQAIFEQFITSALADQKEIKQLPTGTTGFIRINTGDFFQKNYAEIKHYILYFPRDITDKMLAEDSLKLESLGVFRKIDIISSEKALTKFTEDGQDTTWTALLKSNPLPVSIELTLKKEFLTNEKYDSIKNILAELTSATDIQVPYANGLWGLGDELKRVLVFKFVIF